MRQDAHGGVVLQLADEHDAADGGSKMCIRDSLFPVRAAIIIIGTERR